MSAPRVAPAVPAVPAVPAIAPAVPAIAPVAPGVAPVVPAVAPAIPAVAPVARPPAVAPGPPRAAPRPPGAPGTAPPPVAPAQRPVAPPVLTAPAIAPPPPVMVPPAPEGAPLLEAEVIAAEPAGPPTPAIVPEVEMPAPAFPETGAIEAIAAPQAMAVAQIVGVLNQVDYFQVLRVGHDAKPADIKRAFYRESRTYHPDRFFHLKDEDVKLDVGTVYKRITEAYYFLRDDTKRKKYLADISGPERKAKLRFTEASEVETKQQAKKEAEEQIGTHPKGRQFYATAMKDMDGKRWSDAQRNLKMALTYERENARYKEKLAEVEQKLHEEFKSKGEQFKIR